MATFQHRLSVMQPQWMRLPQAIVWALLAMVLLKTAWVGDDAYITFRCLENAVTGHGLGFNAGERVMAYSHPLWMLLQLPFQALFHSPYWVTLALSFVLSMVTLWQIGRSWGSTLGWLALPLLVIASKAFVEYCSSGLENPLTHFLLVAFVLRWWRFKGEQRQLLMLSLIACGLVLTRMDLVLLVGPALGWTFWQYRSWRALGQLALGMLPLLLWEGFAILYYGFPFPNTAYAKLATGIAQHKLWLMGWQYFRDSFMRDPVTLPLIAVGLFAGLRSRRQWPLVIGMLLYLVYVLRIGGDFMSGRFFTALFLLSLLLIGQWLQGKWHLLLAGGLAMAASFLGPTPMVTSGADYNVDIVELLGPWDIADERACFYYSTGLLQALDGREMPAIAWADSGRAMAANGPKVYSAVAIGILGYYAGPSVYVIDKVGLADPLIARMPTIYLEKYRAGHFMRLVPDGYTQSVLADSNLIADKNLHDLYGHLRHITRGPLFSSDRLASIWQMNFNPMPQDSLAHFRIPTNLIYKLPSQRTRDYTMTNQLGVKFQIDTGANVDSMALAYRDGNGITVAWLQADKPIAANHIRQIGSHKFAIPAEADAFAIYPDENFYALVGGVRVW